jgi:hypothetical protein
MGFFSRIFSSYNKSKKLSEITRKVKEKSKKLEEGGIYEYMTESKDIPENTIDIVMETDQLKKLIEHYETDREELEDIFSALERGGAGQIVNGHYVPSSSLAFFSTLNFVLEYRESLIGDESSREEIITICDRLVRYFRDNETGDIL